MAMSNETKIAGKSYRKENWLNLRKNLLRNNDPELNWIKAYSIYQTRINTRLFAPIRKLLENGNNEGEGFSIAILQSVLLEHFATIYYGKFFEVNDYFYLDDDNLQTTADELIVSIEELRNYSPPNTYWNLSSRDIVIMFLTNIKPFSDYFDDIKAKKYYNKIRSALIHTSNTSVDSMIRIKSREGLKVPIEISADNILIFYRNSFQNLLIEFWNNLKTMILNQINITLRKNIIAYLDHVTDIKRVWYFAYGSNLSEDRLIDRIGYFHSVKEVSLMHFKLKFNKISVDGTGKANIEYSEGSSVKGLCFLIDHEQLKALTEIEKGYILRDFAVRDSNNNIIIAKSFYSIKTNETLKPGNEYFAIIEKAYQKYHWNLNPLREKF